jgi:uncharacterized membrane protein YfcA
MARPNLSYLKNLILALVGVPCGVLTGLTGIGNSVVLLPLLRWLIALKGQPLSGTTLTIMFFSAMTGLLAFGQNHDVLWLMGVALIVGYIPGAILGSRFIPPGKTGANLRPLWAVLTIGLGFFMVAHGFHLGPGERIVFGGPRNLSGLSLYGVTFLVGLVVGLISRIADLGGTLMVPALIYLLREPARAAEGTALFVLLIASLPGALRYGAVRQLDSRATIWVSFGAVIGALLGSREAILLRAETALIFLYGIALVLIGLGMVLSPAPSPAKGEESK